MNADLPESPVQTAPEAVAPGPAQKASKSPKRRHRRNSSVHLAGVSTNEILRSLAPEELDDYLQRDSKGQGPSDDQGRSENASMPDAPPQPAKQVQTPESVAAAAAEDELQGQLASYPREQGVWAMFVSGAVLDDPHKDPEFFEALFPDYDGDYAEPMSAEPLERRFAKSLLCSLCPAPRA